MKEYVKTCQFLYALMIYSLKQITMKVLAIKDMILFSNINSKTMSLITDINAKENIFLTLCFISRISLEKLIIKSKVNKQIQIKLERVQMRKKNLKKQQKKQNNQKSKSKIFQKNLENQEKKDNQKNQKKKLMKLTI